MKDVLWAIANHQGNTCVNGTASGFSSSRRKRDLSPSVEGSVSPAVATEAHLHRSEPLRLTSSSALGATNPRIYLVPVDQHEETFLQGLT